jgi:hypothetical protein
MLRPDYKQLTERVQCGRRNFLAPGARFAELTVAFAPESQRLAPARWSLRKLLRPREAPGARVSRPTGSFFEPIL